MTPTAPSSAFDRLHPAIQRWVWKQGWTELRDLQEQAVTAVLDSPSDVILAAATASGKTEAAFLPLLSRMAEQEATVPGFRVLYVSPLKALINDQYGRLKAMGEAAGIEVHRWHGDVAQSKKTAALRDPGGILLITPESLEALFVRRGPEIPTLFGALEAVVVDELHAFIGSERGRQLQSLLHRVDLATRRTRPRLALSATLGDMRRAAEFLRPGAGEQAVIVESNEGEAELRLQLRGYVEPLARRGDLAEPDPEEAIATHLFTHLRGRDNLVFANSRRMVESLADRLRGMSEEARVPVEFFPHHGNLSKELRERLEAALKQDRPATAVCTSTLELGVDIGSVHTVGQIGPPPSVAGLRQRLGRSGRRAGEPAVLRAYVIEPALGPDARADDELRLPTVQTVAMIELLLQRWYEPPRAGALHLSTLVQQLLSVVTQHGGARADQLFRALCADGPFRSVKVDVFMRVLRQLGERGVVQQSTDGTLLLGPAGERAVAHYGFYAAFQSDEEYRIVHAGRTLGTLPVAHVVAPGMCIVFAGKRWRILDVNGRENRITVEPNPTGKPPRFGGEAGQLHDRVVAEMFAVYQSAEVPVYLDPVAAGLLVEGRTQFAELGLGHRWLYESGGQTLLFPWLGSAALAALALAFTRAAMEVEVGDVHLAVSAPAAQVTALLARLAAEPEPAADELALVANPPKTEKHHVWLDDSLLRLDYASARLDAPSAWQRLGQMASGAEPRAAVS